VIRSLDATMPAPSFSTLEQVVSETVASRRFPVVLMMTFALLAATLAGIGLFGVMAYLVAERTQEMGIRLALGAEPRRLVRFVVRDGMILAAFGVVVGAGASAAAAGLLRHMLFRVSAYDPVSFAASAALLVLVALVACWSPASRAARTDPMVVLRTE
jgi:putative ABC transport system permease protein